MSKMDSAKQSIIRIIQEATQSQTGSAPEENDRERNSHSIIVNAHDYARIHVESRDVTNNYVIIEQRFSKKSDTSADIADSEPEDVYNTIKRHFGA